MNATLEQFATINAHITRALPKAIGGLDIEEIIRYAEADDGKLSAALRTALVSLTGQSEQPEAAPTLTVEVVAEFTLGGQNFDAVRVKWTGKRPTREEAIRAADTDSRVVRTDEEWSHVYKHRRELPKKLNDFWLLTARPAHDDPRYVSGLARFRQVWDMSWRSLDAGLRDYGLILRRRT